MSLENNTKEVTPDDVKTIANRAMHLGAGTLIIIALSMTTCTMHSNTYDPARLKETVEIKKIEMGIERAKVDIHRAEVAKEQSELKIIERLVKLGVNPIAARCGVHGWDSDRNVNENTACIVAAGKNTIITHEAKPE